MTACIRPCTSPSQTKSQGSWAQVPLPGVKLLVVVSCWETESVFSKGVASGNLVAVHWKSTHPRIFGQHQCS